MEINYTEHVNDSIRILILLNVARSRKSLSVTDRKIMLLDYYLRFPNTMLSDYCDLSADMQTLDEYYAFFHWQPDVIRYRKSLNYLIAKGFVEKRLERNQTIYSITDRGIEAIGKINTKYKTHLEKLTFAFFPVISKLSDSKIEDQIRAKSNVFVRNGGTNNEKKA